MTGNIIVDTGKKIAAHRIFDSAPAYTRPNYFSVGTGTTNPTLTDTAMETLVQIDGADTKEVVSGYPSISDSTFNITTRCLLLTTDCNGNSITEFGLFNSDGTPVMFSRAVFTAITKTAFVQAIFVEKDKIE